MTRNEFRFIERLRVRRAEVDARQRVFHAHYLAYFDAAMAGYWRALGVPCNEMSKQLGGELSLGKLTLECHLPAGLDDVLDIGIACHRVDNATVVFLAAVFRQEQLLVTAELGCAFSDASTHGAKRVPQELRELLEGFESGRPMVDVRVGSWDVLGPDARLIRTGVFVQEQGIPEDMEWDNADPGCVHAVAYNHFGLPVATGRMIEHVPGKAKIGRMAVSQAVRGSGVGRAVLDALMKAARERGYLEAVLHAQVSAARFYGRAGFVARGSAFDEVGIPHIEMVCDL